MMMIIMCWLCGKLPMLSFERSFYVVVVYMLNIFGGKKNPVNSLFSLAFDWMCHSSSRMHVYRLNIRPENSYSCAFISFIISWHYMHAIHTHTHTKKKRLCASQQQCNYLLIMWLAATDKFQPPKTEF